MLIDSPRLKPGDREAWAAAARLDGVVGRTRQHRRRVDAAEERIAVFARGRRGYVATSWGKDSTALAALACTVTDWPLVWVRFPPVDNPDCEAVRDAFLAAHPGARYEEISAPCRMDADGAAHATGTLQRGVAAAARRFGRPALVGLRAAESAARRRLAEAVGWQTAWTGWPILDWSAVHVFAHLEAEGLPVHPVYAMSHAGAIPRERLRVAMLGGRRGRGTGRLDWELAYYPESRRWLGSAGQGLGVGSSWRGLARERGR